MKKSIVGLLGIVSLFVIGCKEQTSEELITDNVKAIVEKKVKNVISNDKKEEIVFEVNEEKRNLIVGLNNNTFCYVGQFEAKDFDYNKGGMPSNKITIQFDSIINDSLVYGHSIVAGNLRPFKGTIEKSKEEFLVYMNKKDIYNSKQSKVIPFFYNTKTINGLTSIHSSNKILYDSIFIANLGSGVLERSSKIHYYNNSRESAIIESTSFPFFNLILEEPGDNKYDGVFNITFNDSIFKGTWESYNKKLAVNKREFRLEKTTFSYKPNLYLETNWIRMFDHGKTKRSTYVDEETGEEEYYDELVETLTEASSEINASTKELTKEDVENLYKTDLEIIRNAIYARHGYSFKNRKIRNIFDRYVEWYVPFSVDVSSELTALEKKNIALIKRYEKHAETYYDTFGR